jgi:LmbE family N-acetylglucosaminyl deacetylase
MIALVSIWLLSSSPAAASWFAPTGQIGPAPAGSRVLIVAPHIDDEALGAGGYAQDAISRGAEVFVVYLTVGEHSRTSLIANRLTFFATASLNRKGERRLREAAAAWEHAGIPTENLLVLGYPDRGLHRMMVRPDRILRSASTGSRVVRIAAAIAPGSEYRAENLVRDLRAVIELVSPDVIMAPVTSDHHSDHRVAANLVAEALAESDLDPLSLGYLIHRRPSVRGIRYADTFSTGEIWIAFDLEPSIRDGKRRMLSAYRSQRRSPYLRYLFASHSRGPERFLHVGGPAPAVESMIDADL